MIYLCNAIDEATCIERVIASDSPAATLKVVQITRALRRQKVRAIILSLGRGAQHGTGRWFRARAGRLSGVPVVYAPFFDFPGLTHLVTLLALPSLLRRLGRRFAAPVLLTYNRLPHYWVAAELAAVLGYRRFLDLEDGTTAQDGAGLRASILRQLDARFNVLCSGGALLAAEALSRQYGDRNTRCCYGVAAVASAPRNWRDGPLVVLLGGTIQKTTGADLFVEAVERLRRNGTGSANDIEFVVTGMGDHASALQALAQRPGLPRVRFLGRVSRERYKAELSGAHVGLCLKLPSSELGDTTFPSKVVEISASGLLLLTTRVSDVPRLFGEEGALYLDREDPDELAGRLVWLTENRNRAADIARRGQTRIGKACSEENVGNALAEFFFPAGGRG